MDERAQKRPFRRSLEDTAWLAQAHAAAGDGAERELPPDERVEVDPARDDVPPVLTGGERR